MTTLSAPKTEGFFDPCPLHVLAEHMREGRWLDIKTDEGLIQRARIVEIVVRVQGEDVIVRQDWLDGDDEDVERYKHQFPIDSDAIWRVLPTNYHIEQVEPWGLDRDVPDREPREAITDGQTVRAVSTTVQGALHLFGLSLDQLQKTTDWKCINERYAVIIVIYELTDLSPLACCQTVGYESETPWHSAVADVAGPRPDGPRRREAERLAALVDQQLLPGVYRRSKPFPLSYRPVLSR